MKTFFTQFLFWKIRRWQPALIPLALLLCTTASAQNLLTEGFEGSAFPPANWSAAATSGSFNWARVASFTGNPAPPAHTGSFMARYNSFSAGSGSTAELRTPSLNFTSMNQVQVSFWMYRDPAYANYLNEKVDVYVNTTASSTGGTLLGTVIRWTNGATTLAPAVATAGWYKYTVNVPATYNGSSNYIVFKATSQFGNDMYLDDISVDNLLPCTGRPDTAIIAPAGVQTICPGTAVAMTASRYTVAANINFQWWQSTNGGTTWVPAAGGTGANTTNYTSPALSVSTMYALHTICTNSTDSTVSNIVTFNVSSAPTYAALPFSESFENWTNRCSISDIPSASWTNIPFTGNNSFRRDDQGSTASWTSATTGGYTPIAVDGVHSARFHASYANSGSVSTAGQLSMYINCSGSAGAKELQFYARMDQGPSIPQDSLIVDTSTDGGATFGVLRRIGPSTGTWNFYSIPFPSTSATTVIRFRAWQNYNCTGCAFPDILIDGVKVLPPCAGKPTAGSINPVSACSGQNFNLSLTGTSATAGLGYTWQFLPQGSTGPWQALAGGNVANPTANITVPTYFRAIVNCTNGTPADVDTSAPILVNLAPFYYCYCAGYFGSATYWASPYVMISNVTIRTQPANVPLLNNGNPLPITNNPNIPSNGYTDYRYTVPPPVLIRDSTYKLSVSEASFSSWVYNGYVATWIDFNKDGIFQNPAERIMTNQPILSTAAPTTSINFTIPSNAGVGLTGMRVAMNYTSLPNPSPCGQIGQFYGEVEDYLVYIDYPPCTGPVNPGLAFISDTAVCPGYSVDFGDTTYEKQRTNINRMWQYTTSGGAVWLDVPGSANKDTVNGFVIHGATQIRLRAVCGRTGDTTFSNRLVISTPDPVRCYPYAEAIGGPVNDSTDIGAFVIGNMVNPAPVLSAGPHLNNPFAVHRRTDFTLIPGIELYADSTYRLAIFQTMSRGNHSDALVSVFMDFNNDLRYNVGATTPPFSNELVFQGITRFDSFFLDTKIKIPGAVIPNVLTGMRVIINSDLSNGPGNPANSGQGAFTSGEVEDYVVIFRRAALGVGGQGIVQNLSLYPNPTEGKFTVLCDAGKNVSHLEVNVSTITGQQVVSRSFDNVGAHFTTTLDLGTQAKGVYFVEIKADGEKITRKLVVR